MHPIKRTIHLFNKLIPYKLARRKLRIRILVLFLIFFTILLYVTSLLKSSYLFFVIWGLQTSSSSSSAIVTWEIPDFAYYNNQLLLHFGTIAYMPPGTQFLSPDFRYPSLRGMNGCFVSITEIFDRHKLNELHVFDRQSLTEKNLKIIKTPWVHVALEWLVKTTTHSNMNKTVINITNYQNGIRTENLWKIIFTRLIVHVFLLNRKNDVIHVSRSFKYINFVQSCVSSTLIKYPNLTRALGIHLRTWAADISIGSVASRECLLINGNNPLNFFFQCQLSSYDDLTIIISSIQRAQDSLDQPIYLATDNHQSPLVLELKRRYSYRLLNIEETCHRDNVLSAMIENELLTQTQSFLGSFFSTFSLVVAIRRELRQTYFIQSTMQFYFYQYLTLIVIVCVLLCFFIILKITCFFL